MVVRELKRRYVRVIEEAGVKICVTKVPGTCLKMKLQVSDPFKKKKCESGDCIACREGDGGKCRTDGLVYKLTCKGFDDTYVGRIFRKASGIIKKHQLKPTLVAQVDERHGSELPKFKMDVIKMHGGDVLLLQISEAVQIREKRGQINCQEVWRQIHLPRLSLSHGSGTCCSHRVAEVAGTPPTTSARYK